MWYKRAANQGDMEAMYNLGCLYRYGRGIHQDLEEAYYWFSLASAKYSGLGNVQMYMDDPKLTPEQIEAVKKRVADWKPSVYKPPVEEKR
jgi:TPR repeat protein